MNAPSLNRLTLLSFVLHITFFVLSSVALKHSSRFVMPSPYTVNLVSLEESRRITVGGAEPKVQEDSKAAASHDAVAVKEDRASQKKQKASEEKHLSERIAALEAKKKIEKIVRLRNTISLRSARTEGRSSTAQKTPTGQQGNPLTTESYGARIGEEIRQRWTFPDIGDKNLETIVNIRVLKDGAVQIIGIEKKSGHHLFDRSVLRAIEKASPVTPPPQEMEIGVRFFP